MTNPTLRRCVRLLDAVLPYVLAIGLLLALTQLWLWASVNGGEDWMFIAYTNRLGEGWIEIVLFVGLSLVLAWRLGARVWAVWRETR